LNLRKGDNNMKVITRDISTVGQLKDALSTLPSETILFPFGSSVAHLVYDEENKQAYIDENFDWIDNDDVYESLEEELRAEKETEVLREYSSVEEMRKDEELQNMGRYCHTKAKIAGKEVIVCTTNQQYDDLIWGTMYDLLISLNNEYDLKIGRLTNDIASELRDRVIEHLEDNFNVIFVDVFEEY